MDRVAVVTGGARRIGRAIAEALHADGYRVLVQYNTSAAEAEALVAHLQQMRPRSAAAFACNLGTLAGAAEGGAALVHHALALFGDVHVLVNGASAFVPTPLWPPADTGATTRSLPFAVDEALWATNAMAPLHTTRALARHVASTESTGTDRCIINMGDALLRAPHSGYSSYCMAKAALENLTLSSSAELGPAGIRVNGIRPGLNIFPDGMPVDMQARLRRLVPLGQREGEPRDIAEVARFLAASRYVSGALIDVDGGLRSRGNT